MQRQVQARQRRTNIPEARPTRIGRHIELDPGVKLRDVHGTKIATRREQAEKLAPVLTVLNQTTRPLHAIASAATEDVKTAQRRGLAHYLLYGGGSAARHAASEGIQNKRQDTFSDVLAQAGVKNKAVRAGAGFVLDVGLDPTTYITGGTGKIGAGVAARASATTGGRVLRNLLRDVNPNIAPEGVTRETWETATSAARTARATTGRKLHETQQRALGIRKSLGKDDARVVDAIERNNIKSLPEHLKPPAIALRSHYRYVRRLEKQAGIRGGTIEARGGRGARSAEMPSTIPLAKQAVGEPPPVPEGHVRLYRGEGVHRRTGEDWADAPKGGPSQGRWFTADLDRAKGYASEETAYRRGYVKYVDVPEDVARAARIEGSGESTFVLPPKVANRAGELEPGAAKRAAAEHSRRVAGGQRASEVAARRRVARAKLMGESPERIAALEREAASARVAPKQPSTPSSRTRVKGYVPHYTVESLEKKAPSETINTAGSVGKRVIRPASSKSRTREGTLAEKLLQFPGQYNEDAALAYLNRMASGFRDVTQAQLNRRIADHLGRPVRAGKDIALAENEQVFHLKGSDLKAVNDKAELARIAEKGHAGKGGRYVVLNKHVVQHAHAISRPGGSRSEIGRLYDRVQGGFKLVATQPNPAFHIRNLIGDIQNAYLGQPGHRLPANLAQASKALRALGREEVAQRTLGKAAKEVRGSVKIGGRRMTYEELADEAAKVGAIRSGFTARELHDLIAVEGGTRRVTRGRASRAAKAAGQKVKRVVQGREDLPRLATYIAARKRGLAPEAAARQAAKFHFDYANLSEFERKYARRALPFYTFTARNVPLQAKMLLTKPGKYANYEKVREEAAKAAGLAPGWEKGQPEYQQRQAGVPVRWKGHVFTVNVGGLPLTDLNEFPGAAGGPVAQADEWMQRGASMVGPIIKDPVELWANYSTFFRDPIRRPNAPLVAAPSFVGSWPQTWKDRFHIAKIVDKRTGKKVWGWDAKADYVARALNPGLGTALMGLSSGAGKQGQGTTEKVIGLTGVRPTPYDPVTTEINRSYKRLDAIQTKLGALSQQGVKDRSDPRRVKLNAEARELERLIFQLSRRRKDVVLPKRGGGRKSSGGSLFSAPRGGGGSLFDAPSSGGGKSLFD